MPLPLPLSALRAFEAAARTGSFRTAADDLGFTPSAVSHAIRGLEQTLGAALGTVKLTHESQPRRNFGLRG